MLDFKDDIQTTTTTSSTLSPTKSKLSPTKTSQNIDDDFQDDISLKITFQAVCNENLKDFKRLNTSLFPMSYNDSYYHNLLLPSSFAFLIYYNKKYLIGTMSSRIEEDQNDLYAYIMTFGVLAPYRRLRIGTIMLTMIKNHYYRIDGVKKIILHVHTENEKALEFYLKNSFKPIKVVPDYYRKLNPSSAYLLMFDL